MKRFNEDEVDKLAQILKNDGVISVPTDTVYGICARIDSIEAYNNLIRTKNRPLTKPFPVMCANIEQIKKIAIVDEKSKKIIDKFMPGPITIVLNKQNELQDYITNGKNTIAIRMATSKALEDLIKKTESPIFMSSANKSGEPTCTNLDEIENECPNLDGMMEGTVRFGKGSTIVDCVLKELKILRDGPITIEQIREVLEG